MMTKTIDLVDSAFVENEKQAHSFGGVSTNGNSFIPKKTCSYSHFMSFIFALVFFSFNFKCIQIDFQDLINVMSIYILFICIRCNKIFKIVVFKSICKYKLQYWVLQVYVLFFFLFSPINLNRIERCRASLRVWVCIFIEMKCQCLVNSMRCACICFELTNDLFSLNVVLYHSSFAVAIHYCSWNPKYTHHYLRLNLRTRKKYGKEKWCALCARV